MPRAGLGAGHRKGGVYPLPTSGGGNPAPTLSSINPAVGNTFGLISGTLTGTGFLAGMTITIGGTACTSIVIVSSTSATFITPAKAAGTYNVVATNTDAQAATLTNGFVVSAAAAPTITACSPSSGPTGGTTALTLTTTGVYAGATVTVGGASATSVVIVNPTQITCVAPAGTAGAKNIVVTNTDAQTGTLSNGYTYTGAGSITGQITLDGGSTPVIGATVHIIATNGTITSTTTDNSGNFSFTNIANDTYTLKGHGPLGFALGLAGPEPDSYSIVVNSDAHVQNIKMVNADFWDDFNGQNYNGSLTGAAYTSSADLRTNAMLSSRATLAPGSPGTDQVGGLNSPAQIELRTTDGPHGAKCMRYNFPDRTSFAISAITATHPPVITVPAGATPSPATAPITITGSNCTPSIDGLPLYAGAVVGNTVQVFTNSALTTSVNVTVSGNTGTLAGHIQYNMRVAFRIIDNNGTAASQLSSSKFWFILDEKMSSPWQNGAAAIAAYDSFEYKFLLFTIGGGGGNGVVNLLLYGGHSSSPTLQLDTTINDDGSKNTTNGAVLNTFGVWRRWTISITGIGTNSVVVTIYLNGILFNTTTLTGSPLTWNGTYLRAIQVGANINSGPSQANQYRDFALVHLSRTRPRLVPNEAP